jgi:glycosyltransferase involved in cell wall biosynthesis
MPEISVFLPTHDRASTLPYAIRSVQAQNFADLEILICGDGVTDDVRTVVADLQRADPRIRFFDLPKAPHRGELNRDHVMRQALGEFIFHHNDDDLWLPGHIGDLRHALYDADFVGAMQVMVEIDGTVRAYFFDLERPEFVEPWLAWKPNNFGPWANDGFSPIFAAHRRDAFLRLPEGWTTTPPGLPADQAMWHKFLRQPWCRARFLRWPVALQFASTGREHWTPYERAEELKRWTEIVEAQDWAPRIWRSLLPDLGNRLLSLQLERSLLAEAEREFRQRAEAERDALRASTSWRITAPLRRAVTLMRRGRADRG